MTIDEKRLQPPAGYFDDSGRPLRAPETESERKAREDYENWVSQRDPRRA